MNKKREKEIRQEIDLRLAGGFGNYVEGYEEGFIEGAKWADKNPNSNLKLSHHAPIPITEEWLTKQGFKREYDFICEYTYYIREIDGYYVDIQFGCSNMGDEYVNCHIDNCSRCTVASADIQHVHQLQNLLNIMNIKFDIKQ